jgi:hypothetical protein
MSLLVYYSSFNLNAGVLGWLQVFDAIRDVI